MKNVVILGSTGSIGENAVRVCLALPNELRVVGLAVQSNYTRALEQAALLNVKTLAVVDPDAAQRCRAAAPPGVRVLDGQPGIVDLAATAEANIVLCAVVGMAGLHPVLSALHAGKDVALATKEVLVAAGSIVTAAATAAGARILPVDSEHSAIFQCLQGCTSPNSIERLILTASGGPFTARPDIHLPSVTPRQALAHPRWNMGPKVTIDSATLMNKGLEMIEAHWLFNLPMHRISVLIHPESIVHSMVEFVDGSILSQMSLPDMRFAIQYALTYPARKPGGLPPLDLATVGTLHFSHPDTTRFPCLTLATNAAATGGTVPAVLNAANEVAVERFLQGEIGFTDIWKIVEKTINAHTNVLNPSLDEVLHADNWARRAAMH